MKRHPFKKRISLVLIFTICNCSVLVFSQEIKHELLPDGVEYWYHSNTDSPLFFQLLKEIWELAVSNEPFNKSIAFLVGVSSYRYIAPQLPFVKNDLEEMRNFLLNEGGFDEIYIARDDIVDEYLIENYMENIFPEKLDKQDRLLFYYSGHGADREGSITGYMQFSKAKPGDFAGLQVMPISEVKNWCSELKINHLLFIFDSCASGLAFQIKGKDFQIYDQVIATLSRNGSRTIITAGTANEKTFEVTDSEGNGNGIFTRAFLNAIQTGNADKGKNGIITIDEIMAEVQNEIASFSARYKQSPISPKMWVFDPNIYRGTFVFINPQAEKQGITLHKDYRQIIEKAGKSNLTTRLGIGALIAVGGGVAVATLINNNDSPSPITLNENDDSVIKVSQLGNDITVKNNMNHEVAIKIAWDGAGESNAVRYDDWGLPGAEIRLSRDNHSSIQAWVWDKLSGNLIYSCDLPIK